MRLNNIYLSASQQNHNMYIGGQFTEQEAMNIYINDHLAPKLRAEGFEVKTSVMGHTMEDNINEANAWMGKYGIYIAHHTNASGTFSGAGTHDGTLILDFGSIRSKILAKCLYDEIAPVTPSTDEGIKDRPELAELRKTLSVAALIEIFYHDNLTDVKWGLTHFDQLADAEVRGIKNAVEMLAAA